MPDQEHKNIFKDIPVLGFCNGKTLKYILFFRVTKCCQVLNKPESLNHVEKVTVSFLTLYVIQILFLSNPVVKYLKVKLGQLTVILRR